MTLSRDKLPIFQTKIQPAVLVVITVFLNSCSSDSDVLPSLYNLDKVRKYPVEGRVFVDEFVVGGKEENTAGRSYHTKKKKVVCAVETTEHHKVKRMYALHIDDYSSSSLKPLFERHISKQAHVVTDGWKGYRPLKKDWQILEEDGKNLMVFSTIHTMIHQVKTTLRTTYSYVSKKHMDRYLNEYCYRVNRSIHKQTIFHGLISRMTQQPPLYWRNISSG